MKKILLELITFSLLSISFVYSVLAIENDEINNDLPELYIKAINPGYTIDGQGNVGEMIEIAKIPVYIQLITIVSRSRNVQYADKSNSCLCKNYKKRFRRK